MVQPQAITADKIQLWSDRIAAWRQSGLTQRAFCEQQQLAFSTFAYWRGRLKKSQACDASDGKVHFLPVSLRQENARALTLRINGRHSIEIKAGFDPDLLARVVRTLESIA
jgi:hypothetical protein